MVCRRGRPRPGLSDQYPWPDQPVGSYGNLLLAHRPRGRHLDLIDETGQLAVQLRCPRAITSVCVAEGTLVIAGGALICLEIDGLSPLTRSRVWRPFTRGGSASPQSDRSVIPTVATVAAPPVPPQGGQTTPHVAPSREAGPRKEE